jgi:adenylate cyclase class 2
MPPVETEVKFYLPDPAPMRARLAAIGARCLGRLHEHNVRLEDQDRSLGRKKSLLRLRQDRAARLTFKSTPENADPEFKQLHELEVEVGDFEAMLHILAALGFEPVQRYEKWRESWALERTVFCLDRLPYGDFLEIEGAKADITAVAGRLGLDWGRRILWNYLEIFELVKTRHILPFADLTFENFTTISVDIGDYLHLLEAGRPRTPDRP